MFKFYLLLISFMFTGIAGGVYPFLVHYISEFSRWYKPVAIVFWVSWLTGLILATITVSIITKGA